MRNDCFNIYKKPLFKAKGVMFVQELSLLCRWVTAPGFGKWAKDKGFTNLLLLEVGSATFPIH